MNVQHCVSKPHAIRIVEYGTRDDERRLVIERRNMSVSLICL